VRNLCCATIVALLAVAAPATAAPRTDCRQQAIRDLQRLSPQGHAIYSAMPDKKLFMFWVTCDDTQLGLATAVHESVHILTEQMDAYPLIGGGSIRRLHEVSRLFPPREIAGNFDRSDIYVQTYLRPGAATSATDLMYLLDELNAYTHDLNSAIRLAPLNKSNSQVDHRDGLTALMAFVMSYVDRARRHKPATWEGLQRPEPRRLVQVLWRQAEATLTKSWDVPGIGHQDRKYVAFMCDHRNSDALAELLGRTPISADACAVAGGASSRASTR
jgi:hypothetical protein